MDSTTLVRLGCAVLAVVFLAIIAMRRKSKNAEE
jgi:hypothetical protein